MSQIFEAAAGHGVKELYEDSYTFNRIAGSIDNISRESFDLQLKLIEEEVKELREAFNSDSNVEQLDGCIDILVTTFGFIQKLQEAYSCNVAEACYLTGDNNLSKFPTNHDQVQDVVEYYADKGQTVTTELNKEFGCYVIKNTNGKVMKPRPFYKDNDLTVCFPEVH
jgi:hypothetical protein